MKHKDWLATLELASDLDRQTLDSYLARLQELESSCAELASAVEAIAEDQALPRAGEDAQRVQRDQDPHRAFLRRRDWRLPPIPQRGASSWPSWAWCLRSTPAAPSVARAPSPRRAIATCGSSWWKRPGTTEATIRPAARGAATSRSRSANRQLRQPRRQATEPQVPAPAAARQAVPGGRHRRQPRALRVHLGRDGRPGGLKHDEHTRRQVMERTEKVASRLQNPRTQLLAVGNPTDPSLEREASCRRYHWAAVSNPRISVWSIVAAPSSVSSITRRTKEGTGRSRQHSA